MKFAGFIGPSYEGLSTQADAEQCINLLPETVESATGETKTQRVLLSRPGLAVFAALGATPGGGGGGGGPELLALAWTIYSPTTRDTAQIWMSSSTDGGHTWSTPAKVIDLDTNPPPTITSFTDSGGFTQTNPDQTDIESISLGTVIGSPFYTFGNSQLVGTNIVAALQINTNTVALLVGTGLTSPTWALTTVTTGVNWGGDIKILNYPATNPI